MPDKPQRLARRNGNFLAYHQYIPEANIASNSPEGIIFLGGYKSDMQGTKALFLQEYAEKNSIPFIRFDYFGHGESSGEFAEGTIGIWREDAEEILKLTKGKQLLVGSSMGGWLMLLTALKVPEKIWGLLGIASAPDFSEELIWNAFTESQKKEIQQKGNYTIQEQDCPNTEPSDFPVSWKFIEEARDHLLLKNTIELKMPVTLLHGMNDADVPYTQSVRLAEKLVSEEVQVHLLKNADHRMSTPEALELLEKALNNVFR